MSFLIDVVIPQLDAAEAGLLDEFNPKRKTRYWVMDCPTCQRVGGAFYYPGHGHVNCSHKKNCGKTVTIWDLVEGKHGGDRKETFRRLCEAAGVAPPAREGEMTDEHRLAVTTRAALKTALASNAAAGHYLEVKRGYSRDIWDRLDLGFYSSARWMEATLRQKGASVDLARSWEILPNPKYPESLMADRIVGWWRQPDGGMRLWGRLMGDGSDENPKYRYSSGMSRTIPYGFRKPGRNTLAVVEGPMDKCALEILGVPACASGGNCIIPAQALYLAEQGVESLVYVIDADKAGEDGAVSTIRNCESLGITCFFATPPQGMDVDEMYRAGMQADINAMMETAVNAGALLAKQYLNGGPTRAEFERTRDAWRLRGVLGAYSWATFQRVMRGAGIEVMPVNAEAARLMATLLTEGCRLEDAQEIVARRYGLAITISEKR